MTPAPNPQPSPLNPTGRRETTEDEIGLARVRANETIEWLERLTANPDFERYAEFFRSGMEDAAQQAENIDGNDVMKRDAYAQRYFARLRMLEWPVKQLAACRQLLKNLDEQQAKK